MDFSTFFSNQARKPSGFFGRFVMSAIFDKGNAFLNRFVYEVLSIQPEDHILDIGCGTGKLIFDMSDLIRDGCIEGVDFSNSMIYIARKRNKTHIKNDKVKIIKGAFEEYPFMVNSFDKVCSVNTIYFWSEPGKILKKIACILKPGGIFVVAFEDISQLNQRKLDKDIFHFYTVNDVKNLLADNSFFSHITSESKRKGNLVYHCVVAQK